MLATDGFSSIKEGAAGDEMWVSPRLARAASCQVLSDRHRQQEIGDLRLGLPGKGEETFWSLSQA